MRSALPAFSPLMRTRRRNERGVRFGDRFGRNDRSSNSGVALGQIPAPPLADRLGIDLNRPAIAAVVLR